MPRFTYSSHIKSPVEAVFRFHERPDALERLMPPWAQARVIRKTGGLEVGAEVELQVPFGPVTRRWLARHTKYERNKLFEDVQVEGPFRCWVHEHRFQAEGSGTWLTDEIRFSLPGGAVSDWLGAWVARLQLLRMFRYRHEQTRLACERSSP